MFVEGSDTFILGLGGKSIKVSMQSAYRKHHSTKTALLRVMNNVLRTVDCRRDVVLVMLDLSAAFDSLEHTILLGRLSSYFGFSHTALRWFSSYVTGRIQSITRDLKHRRRNGTTTPTGNEIFPHEPSGHA